VAVKIRLDEMLYRRRMSISELSDRVGVTEPNLVLLKSGGARALRLSTLDSLCEALGCQPGDLLVWEPGGGALGAED
jgi:putative transcriptional regulator